MGSVGGCVRLIMRSIGNWERTLLIVHVGRRGGGLVGGMAGVIKSLFSFFLWGIEEGGGVCMYVYVIDREPWRFSVLWQVGR